jgi:competence protein ComEC
MIKPSRPFARFALAQLAGAFVAGVLLSSYVAIPPRVLIVAALTSSCLLAALSLKLPQFAPVFLAVAFLAAGLTLAFVANRPSGAGDLRNLLDSPNYQASRPTLIEGVLERDPEVAHDRRYLEMRVKRARTSVGEQALGGRVSLLVIVPATQVEEFNALRLRYGAGIRVLTLLDRTDKFRNPGVTMFSQYLDRHGYDATALVKSPAFIERLDDEVVFPPFAWVNRMRTLLQSQVDASFSDETAGVIDAALLGNRHNLTQSTAERFRIGGTFHVLVISGLHITFLGGLVFVIVRRLTRKRILQFLASSVAVWGYSLAVGADPSVMRAALMFSVVVLAPLVARQALSLNALGGVAIILLGARPNSVFDPSFQLTFVAVMAIVVLAWPLLEKMSEIGRWHPTRATPYPPTCSAWLRDLSECLYWSEQKHRVEAQLNVHSYQLIKVPLAGKLERLHFQAALRYIFQALVVSISVQLFLLPFLVVYFHRLSLASFLLNIIVSILMGAASLFVGLALLVHQISSTTAGVFFTLAETFAWLMTHSVDPFENAGLASLRLPEYSGRMSITYALYYLPLSLLSLRFLHWDPFRLLPKSTISRIKESVFARAECAVQLILIAIIVFHPGSAVRSSGDLRIDFLDVGQGDAALITLPEGTTVLVDGGGLAGPFNQRENGSSSTFEFEKRRIGEAVVSEYLWWLGLHKVDYLVATHADNDHIDGLNDIARNFRVRAALVARSPASDSEYSAFAQTLSARGIPVRLIGAGDELRFDRTSINVLWPPASDNPALPSANNDSIVLQVKYGNRSVLMTGDIEGAAENHLLRSGSKFVADVVKVAHHGSRTSSSNDFVAATQAQLGVISVGQTSIFGHPHADVVERWKLSGVELLTTGRSGTISVITDGNDLRVLKFVRDEEKK